VIFEMGSQYAAPFFRRNHLFDKPTSVFRIAALDVFKWRRLSSWVAERHDYMANNATVVRGESGTPPPRACWSSVAHSTESAITPGRLEPKLFQSMRLP